MNREDESPTDPMFEPDAPEAWERLDQIERRLKAARPRPPRLDVAALERLAHETVVDPPAERPTAVVIPRRPPGRGRRPYRRIGVIAGSWACGAVVGALVMFMLMRHTAPAIESTNETARLEKQTPTPATHDQNMAPEADQEVDRRDAPSAKEKVKPFDVDGGALAMILNGFGSADSAYWPEGRTLRAGMHLIQNAADPGLVDPATDASRRPRRDDEGWRAEAPKPYPAPAPAITRERLMREVLSEAPGVVL